MASFITVFLLMRSNTPMNSSGLSTLSYLSPILTSNSSDAPSPTNTLTVVFSYTPSTNPTSAYGTPTHRNVVITISMGTVSKALSRSTNPSAIKLPCTSSLFCAIDLSRDVGLYPVCCSSPLPEPLLFFPEVTFKSSSDPCV